MVFIDILKSYSRKINEDWGYNTEIGVEGVGMIPRLCENYWDLIRETGCTWQPPTLLTLTAVTPSTNKHKLITALGLATGEILSLDEVKWKGRTLYQWDKAKIDAEYDYVNGTSSGEPKAYAFWNEDDDTYIAFYPCVESANSTDCKVTWNKRPVKPDDTNYDTTSPIFAEQYHEVLAEKMALQFYDQPDSAPVSRTRLIKHENNVAKMRSHYMNQRASIMENLNERRPYLFHGEWGE
jgi:hypothetical protein